MRQSQNKGLPDKPELKNSAHSSSSFISSGQANAQKRKERGLKGERGAKLKFALSRTKEMKWMRKSHCPFIHHPCLSLSVSCVQALQFSLFLPFLSYSSILPPLNGCTTSPLNFFALDLLASFPPRT